MVPSQLAVSVMSSRQLMLHVEFASLIQALEGFHRGRAGLFVQESDSDKVGSPLSAAIPSAVESNHCAESQTRIQSGTRVSLSQRLNELRGLLGDELARWIISTDGQVPRSWIDTRNYHAHWDEGLRLKAIDGQEMYDASVRMTHFLRTVFLLMAGVQRETLVCYSQNHSEASQQLLQLNIVSRRAVDPSAPSGVLMSIYN